MGCRVSHNLTILMLIGIITLLLYPSFSTQDKLSFDSHNRQVEVGLLKFLDLDAVAEVFSIHSYGAKEDADLDAAGVFSVDRYGAKGDGVSDDSQAFSVAWNAACTSSASSVFLVPEGKSYLVKTINLSGPCKTSNLTARISGTVVAPPDPTTWNSQDLTSWLKFSMVQGLTIEGGGIIDGSGQKWWDCKKDHNLRCSNAPTAFVIDSSTNVSLKNLTFHNSQQMHVEISLSNNVSVENLQIVAPGDSPNTDGIHISVSQHVVIQNCVIGTGDDCVSIVTESSDIQIKNIVCGPGHGISIGSLGKNNATANVSDVFVDGASLNGTQNGLRIKTWQGGSGYAQGITFQNVTMTNVSNPIVIDQFYCVASPQCQNQTSAVQINNVTYTDITGSSATQEAIRLACSGTVPCTNIVMADINLHLTNGDNATSFSANVHGSSHGQVIPPVNFFSVY